MSLTLAQDTLLAGTLLVGSLVGACLLALSLFRDHRARHSQP